MSVFVFVFVLVSVFVFVLVFVSVFGGITLLLLFVALDAKERTGSKQCALGIATFVVVSYFLGAYVLGLVAVADQRDFVSCFFPKEKKSKEGAPPVYMSKLHDKWVVCFPFVSPQ